MKWQQLHLLHAGEGLDKVRQPFQAFPGQCNARYQNMAQPDRFAPPLTIAQ